MKRSLNQQSIDRWVTNLDHERDITIFTKSNEQKNDMRHAWCIRFTIVEN